MKISIITINYNNKKGLERTIKSVVNQSSHDFEYIVIDGGSNDGSFDVIKGNANSIDYWVSEKDDGIYHAMNKGTFAAHGDYCLFLNSGDVLIDNTVIDRLLSYHLSADIISGSIKYATGRISKAPKSVTMKTFVLGSLPHQSTFIKRELLLDNPYDERFKIGGDWRFFIQVLIYKNASYQKIDDVISLFDNTGVSNSVSRQSELRLHEMELCRDILPIRVENDYKFDKFLAKWKWRFCKMFRVIKNRILFR